MRNLKELLPVELEHGKYQYYLVHFYEDPDEGVFDIALDEWITYDDENKEFWCKFHAGGNPDELKITTSLLKRRQPALKTWKKYPVKIRGGADTYEQALQRLDLLENDPYGFTTSDELYVETRIEELRKKIKNKKVCRDNAELENLFSAAIDDKQSSESMATDQMDSSPEPIGTKKRKTPSTASSKQRRSRSVSPPRRIRSQKDTDYSLSQKKKRASLQHLELNRSRSYHRVPSKSPCSSPVSQSSVRIPRNNSSQVKDKNQTPKTSRWNGGETSQPPVISRTRNFSRPSSSMTGDLPQTTEDGSSLDSMKKQLRELASAVGQLQSQIVRVLEGIDDLKQRFNETPENILPVNRRPMVNLQEHCCHTIEQFHTFDLRLHEDPEFRNLICHGIRPKINLNGKLSGVIGNILRALIHKKVVTHYTAHKKTGDKEVFVESHLWKCIQEQLLEEAMRAGEPGFKEQELKSSLSDAINNIKTSKKYITSDSDDEGR